MSHPLSRILKSASFGGLIAVGAMVVLTAGCGGRAGRPTPGDEHLRTIGLPIALTLEGEVRGMVFGRVLDSPVGLAVDHRNNILMVDAGNDRVIWFNSNLTPLRDIGGHGSYRGLFHGPRYVSTDEDQSVWVSDPGNRRLCRYSDQLEYIDEIDLLDENDPLRFGHPGAVAVTDFGEVWVGDTDNDRVAVLDNTGNIDRLVGDFGYPGGNLRDPAGIRAGGDDNLFVCDAGNDRIVEYDEQGGIIREITHPAFVEPCATTVDDHGRLWVLDRQTSLIHYFDAEGGYVTTLGPVVTGADSPLNGPSDLAILSNGFMVITDTGHHRLLLCRIILDTDSDSEIRD